MRRSSPKTKTGRFTLKLAARLKYPGLSDLLFRALAANLSNLFPDIGQKTRSPAMRIRDGISVRLTSSAIRTPKPRPTPTQPSRATLLLALPPHALITAVPLVPLLPPHHAPHLRTPPPLPRPSPRPSRYPPTP